MGARKGWLSESNFAIPAAGHGQHHYGFMLYAHSTATLSLKGDAHCREVEGAARSHALGEAELIGICARGN